MRVLVTGAAGFIGSHVCERLLARGDAVVGIDNFDPFYDPGVKRRNLAAVGQQERFRFEELDIRDGDAVAAFWGEACEGLDAVVHLAAKAGVRPSIEDPVGYERTNVLGTVNLLQQAARTPLLRFVFGSSSSVYGNNPSVPFRETDRVDSPISPYAATKRAGELICHTYHHLYGLPVHALRLFTVFGPRQRPDLAIHKFTARVVRGQPIEMFGDGSSSRDYTYVDDIVSGILAAADRCQGFEIINLGGEHPVTLKEMIATIEAATGRAAQVRRLPMQPGDVDRTFADVSKARRLLGYEPQMPFEEGVRRFVAWWREASGET